MKKKTVVLYQDNIREEPGQHLGEAHPTSQPHGRFDICQDDCESKTTTSTQFLQIQEAQFFKLPQRLERYCNVLPVFGLNGGNNDLNVIKMFLVPILFDKGGTEHTGMKDANQFISFKNGVIQLLEEVKVFRGVTSLDSLLKAYKLPGTKGLFPYEWLD